MPSLAKSPNPSPSRVETARVPSPAAVRIRRLARNPVLWFLVLLVAARVLTETGWLPPLDWLPGEPRR